MVQGIVTAGTASTAAKTLGLPGERCPCWPAAGPMLPLQRLFGAVVWYVLVVVNWWHGTFLEPAVTWWLDTVLGTWEESLKAFLRESFATATRLLNGTAAFFVSLFFKSGYYEGRAKNRRCGGGRRRGARHGAAQRSATWFACCGAVRLRAGRCGERKTWPEPK